MGKREEKFTIRNRQSSSNERKPIMGDEESTLQPLLLASSPKKDQLFSDKEGNYSSSNVVVLYRLLRRLLLLIIIVAGSCLVLWRLYLALSGDFNYLGVVDSPSILGKFKQYAVSTDAKPCAPIGKSLLAKGGSAVDAAIGTLICMGVTIPNSLGLGGGCIVTIYDRKKKHAVVIDGREIAPDYANETMYANDPDSSTRGPLSLGVPGELAAYWKAHQMYGKLNWSELFDDSIILAEKGVPMVEHLSSALRVTSKELHPNLRKLFTNSTTGKNLVEGEILTQKALADTLRRIRDHGAAEFYGGQTGRLFIEDLKELGGKLTLENLMKYEAVVREPLVFNLGENLRLFTPPPPGSGIILSMILRVMKELGYFHNLKPQESLSESGLFYHRLAETFKFAYAQRAGIEDMPDDQARMEELMKKLSSSEFIKETASKIDNSTHDLKYYGVEEYFGEDHGTAHVSVMDAEGNGVAVTTSVNLYFGSGLLSQSTGIIYNDVMDDFVSPNLVNRFKLPPSKFNLIKPGRRPTSSMTPSVFTDANDDIRLIVGGSGGSKITTAIAYVSIRNCFLDEDIKTAIDGSRIHHQLLPNYLYFEGNFPKELLDLLSERGHEVQKIEGRSSVIMAIANDQLDNNTRSITANSDYRKGGSVEGI